MHTDKHQPQFFEKDRTCIITSSYREDGATCLMSTPTPDPSRLGLPSPVCGTMHPHACYILLLHLYKNIVRRNAGLLHVLSNPLSRMNTC